MDMKTYTLFWLTGKAELIKGNTPEEAMTLAGYGGGAVRALDFYGNGDIREKYKWNAEQKTWDSKPCFSQDFKQAKVKNLFLMYFDGCYGRDAVENTSNTFTMGVCKLEYEDNTLTVHLRRPGLLIGKGGCIIDALAKHLGCKIDIVEVSLLK